MYQTNTTNFETFKKTLHSFDFSLLPQEFPLPYDLHLLDEDTFNNVINSLGDQSLRDLTPSVDTQFKFNKMPANIVNKIAQFDFLQYFSNGLRKVKNFFGFIVSEQNILSYSATPIKNSLMNFSDESLNKKSVEIFKMLLICMQYDNSLIECPTIYKYVNQIMDQKDLKDEIYAQILKQLLNNKNRKYLLRIYEILSIVSKVVCAPNGAVLSMMNYCINKYIVCTDEIEAQQIRSIVPALLRQLTNENNYFDQLILNPTKEQIAFLISQKQLNIFVDLCFGYSLFIGCEYYENIHDIKIKILEKLKVDLTIAPIEYFGIFSIKNEENNLDQTLLDNGAIVWQILASQQSSLTDQKQNYHFLFKILFPYKIFENDYLTQTLYFSQFLFDVFSGNMVLNQQDLAYLMKLFHYFDKKDFRNVINKYKVKNEIIENFKMVRSEVLLNEKEKKVQDEDYLSQQSNVRKNIFDLMNKYEQRIGTWFKISYTGHNKTTNEKTLFKQAHLVIRPFKLCILNNGLPINVVTFAEIMKWEIEQEQFLQFKTEDEIVHIIQSTEKNISQIKWLIKNQAVLIVAYKTLQNRQKTQSFVQKEPPQYQAKNGEQLEEMKQTLVQSGEFNRKALDEQNFISQQVLSQPISSSYMNYNTK